MAEFQKVAKKSEVPEGGGKTVEVGGKKIALFNIQGSFHAIEDTCRHKGGPLGEGSLEGSLVTCPWHGWEYDVTTGACRTNPAVKVAAYQVRVEGEDILLSA